MSCRRGSINALCDDALAEILVHLDAASVLRCRAVCRSWHRIATGRSFLVAHAARRPREMVLETKHGFTRRAIVPPSPDLDMVAGDGRHRYLFEQRPRVTGYGGTSWRCCIELCASLDGLLVLQHRGLSPYIGIGDVSSYIICNPVTRQWTNLPPLCPATIPSGSCFFQAFYGFYLHASSDEYRLLFRCVISPSKEPYFCIVSAGHTLPRRLMTSGPVLDEDDRRLPVYYLGE